MFELLRELGAHVGGWTYLIAGALAFGEAVVIVGLVLPGENGLLVAEVAVRQGWIALGPMLAVASFAAIAGDGVAFHLGSLYGSGMRARCWAGGSDCGTGNGRMRS